MKKVFRKIGTTEEIPYGTQSVMVEKQVVRVVKQQLWDSQGRRLSVDELADAGFEVLVYPDQTQEYNDYHAFTALFAANPDLALRVQDYKECFDELGIAYNSNTDQMEAAIVGKFGEDLAAKTTFYTRMQTALTNVKVNYQAAIRMMGPAGEEYAPADDFITWYHTPLLIQFMPASNPVEPPRREPYVATVNSEQAEAEENSANAARQAALDEAVQEQTEGESNEEVPPEPETETPSE